VAARGRVAGGVPEHTFIPLDRWPQQRHFEKGALYGLRLDSFI
ncbi:hypothetical protein LCGC14_2535620, partial [marine sediment metagenome]